MGLKSISPAPDFGPDLSIENYGKEIGGLGGELGGYSTQVAAPTGGRTRLTPETTP